MRGPFYPRMELRRQRRIYVSQQPVLIPTFIISFRISRGPLYPRAIPACGLKALKPE